jgi:hypothetical protein
MLNNLSTAGVVTPPKQRSLVYCEHGHPHRYITANLLEQYRAEAVTPQTTMESLGSSVTAETSSSPKVSKLS